MSKKNNATRSNKKAIWIAVAAVAIVAIVAVSFFTSPAFNRMKTVGKIGDDKITEAEYAYFYQSTFQDYYSNLYNTYGEATQYFIDTSKPLDQQRYSDDLSVHQYINNAARDGIKEIHVICNAAKDAGYTISEVGAANVAAAMASLEVSAQQTGYTVPLYLRAVYGHGMNKALYKKFVEGIILANEYSNAMMDSYSYTDEDIDAFYQADKMSYDTVDVRMFFIKGESKEDGSFDVSAAETKANEALNTCKDEDSFAQYGADVDETDDIKEADDTLYSYVKVDNFAVENMPEWVFDEARQYGDTEAFAYETGYYVIFYIGRHDIDYNTVNMRHILVIPSETNEDGSFTDEAFAAARDTIDEYMAQWEASDKTEETFAQMANSFSDDPGSNTNGGLYTDIYKGQMTRNVNNWIFDEARQYGDTDIVETENGIHILYFGGVTENNYKTMSVTQDMMRDDYTKWFDAASAEVEGEIPESAGSIMLR